MPINIQSGISLCGLISISSNKFASTAWVDLETNEICHKIRRRAERPNIKIRNKKYYIPLPIIFKIYASLLSGLFANKKSKLPRIIAFVTCYVTLFLFASDIFNFYFPEYSLNQKNHGLLFIGFGFWAVFCVSFLSYTHIFIAPYHGAEHMAISAYNRKGSVLMEDIKQGSPIDDRCGTCFILPLTVITILCCTNMSFGMPTSIFQLICFEFIFQVDYWIGLHKIPINIQFSRLLQTHILTRQPGKMELLVAQKAIQELIAAHEGEDSYSVENSKEKSSCPSG